MIVLFLKGENYNFKTSHVIVYLEELDNEKEKDVHFKTSHVIVYHIIVKTVGIVRIISKHLMLLFIYTTHCTIYNVFLFQNISCYCLSCFSDNQCRDVHTFQNISCYCLSVKSNVHGNDIIIFQNISCYCLSMVLSLSTQK